MAVLSFVLSGSLYNLDIGERILGIIMSNDGAAGLSARAIATDFRI